MRNPNPKPFRMSWLRPYRHLFIETKLLWQETVERLSAKVRRPEQVIFFITKRNFTGEVSDKGFEIYLTRPCAVATGKFISQENGTAIDIEIKAPTNAILVMGVLAVSFAACALVSKNIIELIGITVFGIGVFLWFMLTYSGDASQIEEFIYEIFDLIPKRLFE